MTATYLDYYRDRRCLVTGGRGFIGSALVRRLEQLGAGVFVLDTSACPRYTVFRGVANRQVVEETFATFRPQVVFHLAAQPEVGKAHREPYLTWITNVLGTLNILEQCRLSVPEHSIESVVVASSDKAYGDKPAAELPYTEDMRLCTSGDFYACTKRSADDLCGDYARLFGVPVQVVRAANVYGPGQKNLTTLIAGSIYRIRRGEKPTIHRGAAGVHREWLYIDDATDAYLRLATGRIAGGVPGAHAWNVGSGEVLSVGEVVREILNQMGWGTAAYDVVDHDAPRIGDQRLDSSKFRTHYPEWQPVSFVEGLRRMIRSSQPAQEQS